MHGARAKQIAQEPVPTNSHLRHTAINPNHWYALAQSSEIGVKPVGRIIWNQPVVIFRGDGGKLHALEDRCAHRFVRLSHGSLTNGAIECSYHGWRYNSAGECIRIPNLEEASLPSVRVKTFPIIEKDGFVWVFPGDPGRASTRHPLGMNEWDDVDHIASVARFTCRAHFSFVVENLMDMYHGNLHASYQVFNADTLHEVLHDQDMVKADYRATTYFHGVSLRSILHLMFSPLRKSHSTPLAVTYRYPNWEAQLGDDFKLRCLICPVSERFTIAYLIHFASLEKIKGLHYLPLSGRRVIKRALSNVARPLLRNLARQDVEMIEEEQHAFETHPERHPFEVNSALHGVQRLIRSQASGA